MTEESLPSAHPTVRLLAPEVALDGRLRAAGINADAEPMQAWRELRRAEGATATVIDLYELVARGQGLRPEQLPMSVRHELARAVMPDVWPGWATTAGSDRTDDPIKLVDYDAAWPARFAEWERAVRGVLGSVALRVEHVGSTAVPGLSAKPIIDVQVSVADLEAEEAYAAGLSSLGLQLRSRDALHRYFRPIAGRPRDVHVHVCPSGSLWEFEHLLFRDHLRAHPDARGSYAAAKRAAVARWADDGFAYTDAKTTAVLTILEQARGDGSDR